MFKIAFEFVGIQSENEINIGIRLLGYASSCCALCASNALDVKVYNKILYLYYVSSIVILII